MSEKRNKFKRVRDILLSFVLCAFAVTGCGSAESKEEQGIYERISADDAKIVMESDTPYVLLDVRTLEEYAGGHIEGAIVLPDYEIATKAEEVLKDKGVLILVYCRSGRRSKNAAEELLAMGYRNVKDFGGILDWPYDIVTE